MWGAEGAELKIIVPPSKSRRHKEKVLWGAEGAEKMAPSPIHVYIYTFSLSHVYIWIMCPFCPL